MTRKSPPKHLSYDWLVAPSGKKIPWASREPYTFADGIATSTPSELADSIERLRESLTHPSSERGLTPLRFLLRRLGNEAFQRLHGAGRLKTSADLWLLDDGEQENTIELESAKDLLFRAEALIRHLDDGEGTVEDALIEMMRLTASAIRMELHNEAMMGRRGKVVQKFKGEKSARSRIARRGPDYAAWKAEAEKIKGENPRLKSARSIARIVKKRLSLEDSIENIRKHI